MGGKGHGTVLIGSSAQGNARVFVIENSQAESSSTGTEEDVLNETGSTISEGQILSLDSGENSLVGSSLGARGTGAVNADGDQMTVTDAGDTGLSGTVSISTDFGNNDGWGGILQVWFANVDGKAAYLGDS